MKTAYCFDVDGTITTTEILPCIASELGIADEIALLTRATMDGLLSFEASFRLRHLILSQVELARIQSIVGEIPVDESIIQFVQEYKQDSFLVTGNLDVWVQPIQKLCGCRMFSSESVFEDGVFKIKRVLDKADAVSDIRLMGYERIVAVGDGSNDVPMLSAADISIAFGGVHSPTVAAKDASGYIVHEGTTLCKMLRAL